MHGPDPSVRMVPAGERCDRIIFNPRVEHDDHVIHVGAYRCPHCSSEFEFNTRALRHGETREPGAAEGTWDAACRSVRPLADAWEWFFDFHCPGCRAPVRIIYGHGGDYAMGAHMYELLAVLV